MVTTSKSESKLKLTFDPKRVGIEISKSKLTAAIGLLLSILFKDEHHANYETNTTNLSKPYKSNDYIVSAVIGTDPVVLKMLTEYGERVPASLKVLNESDDHPASTSASPTTLLSLLKNSLKEDTFSDISAAVVRNHNLKFILQNPFENSRHESIICTNIRKHDIHYKNSLKNTKHSKTWLKDTYHSKNSLPDSIHCKDSLSKN
jgi:hypothetical protein